MYFNKFIVFILLQLISVFGYGQLSQPQLDSLVNKYTQNLKARGIDTIFIYNEYCIGCLFQPVKGSNLCAENFSSLPTYIFWKDRGKTFATRKDICFDYSTQGITGDSFWQYFFTNKAKIKKEELKIPQYVEIENGKKNVRSIDIEHSIYFRIIINTSKDSVIKNINSFFFTKDLGPNEELNINYENNIRTSLYHFHMMIQGLIKQESVRSRFIRTLR
jgi:hypothetical protein